MGDQISYVRIGSEVDGDPASLRSELTSLWSLTVQLVLLATGIDLSGRIIQARGGASASAGTHSDGVAVDLRVWYLTTAQIVQIVGIMRACGWPATWFRDWPGNRHIHAVADLGRWTQASYQVAAVKAGCDGLGAGGRKGSDPHATPARWRDYITGPIYAAAQIARLSKPAIPTATTGVLDMSQVTTYSYDKNQPLGKGRTRYLAATREGYWRTHATPGPAVISVAGYATTGTGKPGGATIYIVAENDTRRTARVVGRVPVELATGWGSISGSATVDLAAGECIRLRAAGGSAPVTIANITTTVLH